MPAWPAIRDDTTANYLWIGRTRAISNMILSVPAAGLGIAAGDIHSLTQTRAHQAYRDVAIGLHTLGQELRMNTVGPLTVAVAAGSVFDYFDEVRKKIESAKADLLFVDPYLDADFVSSYLPHVTAGVAVRLLARNHIAKLLPAASLLATQQNFLLQIRAARDIHDRYVFVDGVECYQSGASFKDGAKKAPTTLTQITDAFPAMQKTYEDMWAAASVVL